MSKQKETKHSKIVGGSTAKRVISCPGSVALVQQAPPQKASEYAQEGTLLHFVISEILRTGEPPESFLGVEHGGATFTEELLHEKITPALAALAEIDPDSRIKFKTEMSVSFGAKLPGVFGSLDFAGRLGNTAIMLDWKFGNGVAVPAEENAQLMFYTAAALRTQRLSWLFKDVDTFEFVIVQPPSVSRWTTNRARIKRFEHELVAAVQTALKPDAPLCVGGHCRFCPAKAICPEMTGLAARALRASLKNINAEDLSAWLTQADALEQWVKDVRALGHKTLENGLKLDGWKLVPKRATRKWTDDNKAKERLVSLGLEETELTETTVISPAKAEKALKKVGAALPSELVIAVSSGNTLAPVDDPRPEALLIGQQLAAALEKLN